MRGVFGFNGATSEQTWKRVGALKLCFVPILLQWGHV